ncbi:YjbH domain-containing protein [Kosakonia oryzae]|uniref:Exopolysaccharide biosynthesis protein YbjH n=1 Tax=Kosakonia oryzae TaxID=497725 RepID=A0AA94H6E7_9ENTR|nr:YjbH domain-containing protein [Kosakonia oryzae]ANI85020.1 YjbH domain-containing protein [Kosakonia oryzae]UDJ82283.1 YjbH domain-containing protein [Kosakonia oryzae]SFC97684.1 Exopolysaccharide biosynthesis protein YbjH [Kosakonia oryzae]
MKKSFVISLLALGISAACHAESYPEPVGPSQSDFGGVGLLQTPTARMSREGELSFNYRDNNQYRFYSGSIQLFPWLETTLRYTDVRTRKYSSVEAFSGNQTYKDKAFDVKLRLWQEGYWLPEVSLGARDIGGTGLFDGEYLVANKAWGPFDFSLGIGWGYLGTSGNIKNPLCSYDEKYCTRDTSYKQAGSTDTSQMFRGPTALFGGVEYQTPWNPLRLKLEYEGNNYQQDYAGKLPQRSKVNVGAIYRITDWADINLSYERGNTWMFGFTLRNNFNDLRPAYSDAPRPKYQPQPQDAILQHAVVANQLTLLKYNAGFADPQIQVKGDTLYVTGQQVKYRNTQEGIERANRIIMNDLPDGIRTIRVTENSLNMPIVTTETDVASLKRHLEGEPLGQDTELVQKRVTPIVPDSTEQGWYIDKSSFDFHIDPVLNQSFGGPESFYMYQVGVMATADWWWTDHLLTTGSLFANVANNYDKFSYTSSDSALPRVRTRVREYVQNDYYVNNMQANYMHYLGNNFYGQVYAGYLETMFGGAGAELLWRPVDSHWAFGIDGNYVKQRDWRSPQDMMKFTDYSVKTGHFTAYWTPWFADNVLIKASAGQYLAGDKGVTLDVSKHFDSGVVIGAYATKTNVSAAQYGEGEFTKGVYISVPLDLFTTGPTRSRAAVGWTPLTRDGGQKLGRKFELYDMTNDKTINFQ